LRSKILIIILVSLSLNLDGQTKNFDILHKDLAITIKTGSSMVVTEFKNDFSGIINEMQHLPKYSFSVGASKLLFENWEVGYEFEYSSFHGFQNNPDFSAYRFGHPIISKMRIEPVIYNSTVLNNDFILTYHFNSNKKRIIVPFIYLRGGSTKLLSKLMYKANKELIFSKTGWNPNVPVSSIFVTNYNAGLGFGYEYIISSRISLNFLTDFTFVNDDNLDAVHNLSLSFQESYTNFVSGLYGRVMISATYIINPNRYRVAARTYRLKDSFNKKAQERQIFPWSHKK
jgi:hypothetical protein